MCAIFAAGVIILTGTYVMRYGPTSFLYGLLMSLGSFFIWFVLGLISLPIGLALRSFAGLLPLPPLLVATMVGMAIGLILMPILSSALASSLSFDSRPASVIVVYSLAGIVGGIVWWAVEFQGAKQNDPKI